MAFRTVVLALLLGVAAAFAPARTPRSASVLNGAKDDLIELAEANTDALSPG